MRHARVSKRVLSLSLISLLLPSVVSAATWNEGTNGDLSGDRLSPTSLTLSLGTNSVTATSGGSPTVDREYLHVTLPAGLQLSAINVASYAGTDSKAFIGVQSGSTMTVDPAAPSAATLLGYYHFLEDDLGTNVLDDMATGPGAIGFTPPLAGSDYTFWMQQTGAPATYQLDFVTVPEPAGLTLLAVAGAALFAGRRARG